LILRGVLVRRPGQQFFTTHECGEPPGVTETDDPVAEPRRSVFALVLSTLARHGRPNPLGRTALLGLSPDVQEAVLVEEGWIGIREAIRVGREMEWERQCA